MQVDRGCDRIVPTHMVTSIWIGVAAVVAAVALLRRAFGRRDPGEAANIGSVSQGWVNEHRTGRNEDGLR